MIIRIAEIVFFAVFGIGCFVSIPSEKIILGIVAIIIAIALIIGA